MSWDAPNLCLPLSTPLSLSLSLSLFLSLSVNYPLSLSLSFSLSVNYPLSLSHLPSLSLTYPLSLSLSLPLSLYLSFFGWFTQHMASQAMLTRFSALCKHTELVSTPRESISQKPPPPCCCCRTCQHIFLHTRGKHIGVCELSALVWHIVLTLSHRQNISVWPKTYRHVIVSV